MIVSVLLLPAESCLSFWTCQNWAQVDFSGLEAELSAPGHQSSGLPEPEETIPWSPAASAAAAEDVVAAADEVRNNPNVGPVVVEDVTNLDGDLSRIANRIDIQDIEDYADQCSLWTTS